MSMQRSSFNIQFFVKRTKSLRNGNFPIFARISVNNQRVEFAIKKDIAGKHWDVENKKAKSTCKDARMINDYIEHVKHKLNQIRISLEERNQVVNADAIKQHFLGINEQEKTILHIFSEHNAECKKLEKIDFSSGTVERYLTCAKHVGDFINKKFRKNDLPLSNINHKFIRDFEVYLKTERKCCHNTTVKYIKNFKKIVRIAMHNGWMRADPFVNIKFHLDEVDIPYLDEEELDRLVNKTFKIERLQIVKDVYVFCCFSGLAFIDVKNLLYENIELKNNTYWVRKKRQKTKNWSVIPLPDVAKELIEKYRDHPVSQTNRVVFPVPSNQKMNAYLKEIADLCNIEKNLSTHTARHTFATTVTLSNQVSLEVVSKMLGHSSINMTKRYARVGDNLIYAEMSKVLQKY